MMPQLVTVRVRSPRGRVVRLWIPLLPLLLVLSPVLILAAIVAAVVWLIQRVADLPAHKSGSQEALRPIQRVADLPAHKSGSQEALRLARRIDPVRALGMGWRVLCALPGTRVDIESGRTAVFVNIR